MASSKALTTLYYKLKISDRVDGGAAVNMQTGENVQKENERANYQLDSSCTNTGSTSQGNICSLFSFLFSHSLADIFFF